MSDPYWPLTFMCPVCHRVSRGPGDVADGYCGACHWQTGRPARPDYTCDGCVKGVAVICAWWMPLRPWEPFLVVDYYCAECGRILLRLTQFADST